MGVKASNGFFMEFMGAQRCGDIVGFQFPGEQQVVLFVPGSGDVALCASADWQDLLKDPHSSLSSSLRALDIFPD